MTKKVCISGYYGFNNFGDDAILKILIENLKQNKEDIQINVFSVNPQKIQEIYNVQSTYTFNLTDIIKSIKESDCLISGGGSLLQDATSIKSLIYYLCVIASALIFNKKVIIFAQGIGPINNNFLKKLTLYLLKKCSYITVRDRNSYNFLLNHGIKSVLCSDPVWNIGEIKKEKKGILGIQLREYKSLSTEFINRLAININRYYKDKEICLLSLQNSMDKKQCEIIKEKLINLNPKLNISIYENNSIQDTINVIANLDEFIAMRYHACLIAIKNGVKLFPVSYDIKVEELAKEFNLEYINLATNNDMDAKFKNFINSEINYDKDKILKKNYSFNELNQKI